MDEFAAGKANVYNKEKKLTSETVPSVFAKETFNEFSSFPGTVSFFSSHIIHNESKAMPWGYRGPEFA